MAIHVNSKGDHIKGKGKHIDNEKMRLETLRSLGGEAGKGEIEHLSTTAEPHKYTARSPLSEASIENKDIDSLPAKGHWRYAFVKSELPKSEKLRKVQEIMNSRPSGEMSIEEFTGGGSSVPLEERKKKVHEQGFGNAYPSNIRPLIKGKRGSVTTYDSKTGMLKLNKKIYKELMSGKLK